MCYFFIGFLLKWFYIFPFCNIKKIRKYGPSNRTSWLCEKYCLLVQKSNTYLFKEYWACASVLWWLNIQWEPRAPELIRINKQKQVSCRRFRDFTLRPDHVETKLLYNIPKLRFIFCIYILYIYTAIDNKIKSETSIL